MRPSSLVSVVLAPVLVALVAAPALAAAPSASPKSGIKRVAKRSGAAPYVLPAPTVKDEPLPPLPPPPPSSPSPAPSSAWLPPSTPPETMTMTPAPSSVTHPDADRISTGKQVKPSGGVFQLGTGVVVPAGSFAHGMDAPGPGLAFELRAGAYMTPHFGVLVGFRGSYGHTAGGCDSCKNGYSLQAPVMLQFAHKDRSRGFYGELGLGFGTTYGFTGDDYTATLSNPVELKVGMGYRLAGANGEGMRTTLDVNFGMDFGQMSKATIHTDVGAYDGSIDDAPVHVVMAFSLVSHFSL
jgi:hypothetical protein